MPIERRGKTALLIARGVVLAGYIFLWALAIAFSRAPFAPSLNLIFVYLAAASLFLGTTAISISVRAVNTEWRSFVWCLAVTAIPVLITFV